VIVIVIMAVLATLMIPAYFNVIEKSKNTACETNQRVLLGALEMYGVENPVLPASLSQLRDEDVQRSWAKILSQPGSWKIRLAYAVADLNFKQAAYAAENWLQEYLVRGPACPNDLTPPPLNSSYGISSEFAGKPSVELMNADQYDVIIGDSDTETFDEPTARHTKYSIAGASKFAIAISKGKEVLYIPEETAPTDYALENGGASWRNRGQCIWYYYKNSFSCVLGGRSRDECRVERANSIERHCPKGQDH
ncbi:MAG: hypothetical protein ABIH45_07110, partial [Candidatus Omnitrophota bacterium]